ncbi:MAG: nitronate monooxygenase [Algisphaera sp.]
MKHDSLPIIIQGGMGIAVSGWTLARAVSQAGHLGVVSGTAIDGVMARRLQLGDIGGHLRRALAQLPIPGVAQRVLDRYFIEGGKKPGKPFRPVPVAAQKLASSLSELLVAANFAEVFLAKEGHEGKVGVNFLEKVQLPTLPSLYGVMLAGVDFVLMGAGIPKAIPGVLDRLAVGDPVELALDVKGASRGEQFTTEFDPNDLFEGDAPSLKRPQFLAIVSSVTLANMLARKASGRVDGFIVENASAGGHNAPPRGPLKLTAKGEPIYSERDTADLDAMKALGRPFWLAGQYAKPERVAEALQAGATGVQIGTPFAFCEESGLEPKLKQRILEQSQAGQTDVFTDPVASPTGFPFKVLQLDDTLSNQAVYEDRSRICDLGHLRHAYKKEDGVLGWRCPSEPVADYVRKGGDVQDTEGRKCACNGLFANIDLGQIRRDGEIEKPLVTTGDAVDTIATFLPSGAKAYTAADVIAVLTQDLPGA